MKKKIAIALLSALMVAGAVRLVHGWGFGVGYGRGRRHGRRHGRRGGFHVGVGVGLHRPYRRRHRYHSQYRPWYRRPYYGAGELVGYPKKYNWRDNQGKMYWRITNQSENEIKVSSDRSEIELAPGESKKLYRDNSFVVKITSENGEKDHETSNHKIIIGDRLRIRSYRH